jgi:hypothetical protein
MTRDIARKPCLVHRDPERRISHVQDHRHHRSRQRLSFVSADPVHTFPLVEAIARAEQQIGRAPARLFHLAVPPAAFEPTVTMLGGRTGRLAGAQLSGAAVYPSSTAPDDPGVGSRSQPPRR